MKICTKCKEDKELSEFNKNRPECKECAKPISKAYYEKNRDKSITYSRKYRITNKDKIKKYNEENKERDYQYQLKWYKTEKGKASRAKYLRKWRANNTVQSRLRSRTNAAFRCSKWYKNAGTVTLIGCDFKTAHNHIESQFTGSMSWENRNEWHIDHIIPLASATTEEELIKLCHYTNLQPLWVEDNLRKGSKII